MPRIVVGGAVVAIFIGLVVQLVRLQAENELLHDGMRVIAVRLNRIEPSLANLKRNSSRLDDMSRTAFLAQLKRHDAKIGNSRLRAAMLDQPEEPGDIDEATVATSETDAFVSIVSRLKDFGMTAQRLDTKLDRVLLMMQGRNAVVANLPTLMPARGRISSEFGMRMSPTSGEPMIHKGFDIAAPEGSPVIAAADGVVRFAGKFGGFGNYVSIIHANGLVTKYGHNQQVVVKAGQRVKRGQQIALVGNSGRSAGIHLHFEVWVNDQPVNPRRFIEDPMLGTAQELMGPDAALAPSVPLPVMAEEHQPRDEDVFDFHDPALVAELYADIGPAAKRKAVLGFLHAAAPQAVITSAPSAVAYMLGGLLGACLLSFAAWELGQERKRAKARAAVDQELFAATTGEWEEEELVEAA